MQKNRKSKVKKKALSVVIPSINGISFHSISVALGLHYHVLDTLH